MEVVSIECPKCGGRVHVEDGTKQCFCSYCGTQLVVDDGGITHTVSYRDEARIREAEVREQVALKELEIAEAKRQDRKKILKVAAIAAAVLFVVALVVALFDQTAGMLIGEVALLVIVFAFMFTMLSDNKGADDEAAQPSEAQEHSPSKSDAKAAIGSIVAAVGAIALLVRPWRR